MTPRETSIANLLNQSPMTIHELAHRLGLGQDYVRQRVWMLHMQGDVRVIRTLREGRMGGRRQIVWGLAA